MASALSKIERASRGTDSANASDEHGAQPANGNAEAASGDAKSAFDDILDAAAHCFKENGFAATSIDDVARSLKATKGMIYHHFRSKTDLFFSVYRRGMEINFSATRPHFEADVTAIDRLARMGMSHAIAMMEHQSYQRVLAQGVAMHQTGSTTLAQRETLTELIEIRNSYETMFRRAIEQAAMEQKFIVDDPSLASKSFLAVINSTVFWYRPRLDNPNIEQRALACDLVAFALRGLGAKMTKRKLEKMGEDI